MKDYDVYRLLIVEDNPGDYLLVEDYLSEYLPQAQIKHTPNFAEAKERLGENQFDIILLDLSLPDKSGHSLIEEITQLIGDASLIVLTGYTDIDFSKQAIAMGASDYLVKSELNALSLYKSIVYCRERKKYLHDLRESEKRYSDLFLFSPQPMCVYDPQTFQFVQVNQAALDLYGFSREEVFQSTISMIIPEEDIPALKNNISQLMMSKDVFRGRMRHKKKTGEIIEVEVYSNSIQVKGKYFRLVISVDITEKLIFEKKLTRAIIKTQEDERYEMGAELHDNVCQLLATSQGYLSLLKPYLPAEADNTYAQCLSLTSKAILETRNISHRLAPSFFDHTTLEKAFISLLDTSNVNNQYEVALYFDEKIQSVGVHQDIQLNCYRILQEQLRNIMKHAEASRIEVDILIYKDNLKMRIADNGKGCDFTQTDHGIGVANMKRRVELFCGRFHMNSIPGEGCEVVVEIPLKKFASPAINAAYKQTAFN